MLRNILTKPEKSFMYMNSSLIQDSAFIVKNFFTHRLHLSQEVKYRNLRHIGNKFSILRKNQEIAKVKASSE